MEAEEAETEAAIQAEEQKANTSATTAAPTQHPLVEPAPTNSSVKRVILPVDTKATQTQKADSTKTTGNKPAAKPANQVDDRPRKAQP